MKTETVKYYIAWESKITKYRGRGTAPMSLTDATVWCTELNNRWPNLQHWPEPTKENQQ